MSPWEMIIRAAQVPTVAAEKPQTLFPTRAETTLSVDEIKSLVTYDPITGLLHWVYRTLAKTEWNTRYADQIAGTLTKDGHIQINISENGKPRLFHAHRVAWALMTGEWPTHQVDHENCIPNDNRWENLRSATSGQNNSNRSVVAGKVPYKGVYYISKNKKYAAQIKHERKWQWLGVHQTAEAAAQAYDCAAIQLHGEYAKTNVELGLLS